MRMRMWMRRNKHRKSMMDQRRMWGTDLGPSDVDGMRARMATMRMGMRMRKMKHRKSMMDQRRIWRTDLGRNDVDWDEGEDRDDADADPKEEASQADDGSTQNVED